MRRMNIDRAVARVCASASWLALPLVLLLFLQWPLRDLVQRGSREANDLAQCLFALYIAVAITAATRAHAHLASDALARRFSTAWRRRFAQAARLVGVLPWSLFVLVTMAPQAWASLRQLEAFPETYNPGYFVVKLAVVVMALGVLVQALLDLRRDPDDAAAPRS
jgi:TRAP-type C4-dicarboxylate transport system permease small subunit